MAGIDKYNVLMLHMNGLDTSQTFTDDSYSSHSPVASGNAQIDTAQSVFGGASGLFNGSTDYLSIPSSPDWSFGDEAFTIDFRVRFANVSGNQGFMGSFQGGSSYFYIAKEGDSLRFRDTDAGVSVSLAWSTPTANQWYHIAYVKFNGTVTIYVDGVSIGSGACGTMTDSSTPLTVGTSFTTSYFLNGWMDEVRVTKGIPRWTSNFAIPTAEYTNGFADLTPQGTVSASSIYNASHSADKAVDDDTATQWAGNGSGFPYWWKIDFGSGITKLIDRYSMLSRNDAFWDEIPEDWTFEGSNNDSDWDVLSTHTAVVWTQAERKTFSFVNSTEYRYYRLNISDSQSGSSTNTAISEIEMFLTAEILSDALNITDTIEVTNILEREDIVLNISDSIVVTSNNQDASYANKIISINPLIFVTGSTPPEIIKVDITDPQNLTWLVQTISGITNAQDVTINNDGTYVYVAGTSGKVVKIKVSDLADQTIIDLSDTDNLETIQSNTNFGLVYAGTENDIGELYLIDDRLEYKLDSNFQCLSEGLFRLESNFNIISAFKMDSNFNALSYQTYKINSDFKCLTQEVIPIISIDDIIPIELEDYQVFVNSVELEDTDLILDSITITHSESEESRASFRLSRNHDRLDTTLEGVSSVITNQNTVEIKIKGVTEFSGKISELDCQYQNDSEYVTVNALAVEKENKLNKITISLPGLTSRLSIYDVLIQNPKIYNPYIDPTNEDNPKKYKGIKVNLGTKIEQTLSKWTISDTTGAIADAIQEGTFNPQQNWTYFWSPTVTKFANNLDNLNVGLGDTSDIRFFYIGTSLAPISEDLWNLDKAHHWKQRILDDIETGKIELANPSPGYITTEEVQTPSQNPVGWKTGVAWGQSPSYGVDTWQQGYKTYETYYYIGEAPFKEISVRNGVKITKPKLVDTPTALYSITNASYDFSQYAKKVADLEYENLKNINGNILPDTSCSFNLTIDAYFYYQISLLTQINVDNTTQANIYNNANGFPVSVKSITISSADRQVILDADNTKSQNELDIINSQFPDEDDAEYNEPERSVLIAVKTDMRTRLEVE